MATLLIALSLVPAMESLQGSIQGSAVHAESTQDHHRLVARLEELLATAYADLDAEAQAVADPNTPTSYSDAGGTAQRRLVYLSRYDVDNADADDDPFTGTDAGLVWIRVEIENSAAALETLTGE